MSGGGYDPMVDILVVLKAQPSTAKALLVALGSPTGLLPLRKLLTRLHDAEVLRVDGTTGGQNPERIYALAEVDEDVPQRPGLPLKHKRNVAKFAAIWHELATPTTVADLVAAVQTNLGIGRKLMQRMAAAGLVKVHKEGRHFVYQREAAVNRSNDPRISPWRSVTRFQQEARP